MKAVTIEMESGVKKTVYGEDPSFYTATDDGSLLIYFGEGDKGIEHADARFKNWRNYYVEDYKE